MTYIDTCISDIDNINKVSFIFANSFEMFSRNTIWSRSRQIIALDNGTFEFFIRKRQPFQIWF